MNTNLIYYGRETPLPERIPLRAGPLTMIYENGDLRYVRLGNKLLLLRIYSAARDRHWGTAPAVLSDVEMKIAADHFFINYVCHNKYNDIDFVWQGAISGGADGTVRFSMDGVAQTGFMRNRLGFCVLHPMQLAGGKARITHVDGSTELVVFPRAIAPQMRVNGLLRPVSHFEEMRGLAHEVQPGCGPRSNLRAISLRPKISAIGRMPHSKPIAHPCV